jgi:hypothetical protein
VLFQFGQHLVVGNATLALNTAECVRLVLLAVLCPISQTYRAPEPKRIDIANFSLMGLLRFLGATLGRFKKHSSSILFSTARVRVIFSMMALYTSVAGIRTWRRVKS